MGKNPVLLEELLLQISIEEGEKYDEAYRSWREGFDLSPEEDEVTPEAEPESTQSPTVAAMPPGVEANYERIIGEKDRRKVLLKRTFAKPRKQDSREKCSGFQ